MLLGNYHSLVYKIVCEFAYKKHMIIHNIIHSYDDALAFKDELKCSCYVNGLLLCHVVQLWNFTMITLIHIG